MKMYIMRGPSGSGKALKNGTPVLSPDGWVPIEQLSVGDFVMGSSGTPTQVTGVFPQGTRELYRVSFSDGAFVDCDGDHLWSFYRDRNDRG